MDSRLFNSMRRMVLLAVTASSVASAGEPFGLVTPAWVAEHASEPDVKVLDVRTDVSAYQHGHVPHAVFLANDVLRVPRAGIPVQYLEPDAMAGVFRRAGINADDHVVVYADGDGVLGATMVAYALHRIGHGNVSVMDGGLAAYQRRHPLHQSYPPVGTGDLQPRPDASVFITLEELRSRLEDPDLVLLDTRPAEEYVGNTRRWMRNGHIPGAKNLAWYHLMEPDRRHAFRPLDEMRRIIAATGIAREDEVVVYCGTSREATLVYLVMRHLLDYPRVRLYEGSWTEYASVMELPVARISGEIHDAAAADRPLPRTAALESYECGSVKRMHTWNDIFLASQPQPSDFELARAGGVETVINQRHPSEVDAFDEREVVTGLGLTYFNPAWNGPEELTDEVLDRTLHLLRTAERPVLLHCSSANRTGATWLAYSVVERGLSWEAALAEAKQVGLRTPEYERIVRSYVERRRGGG